jgi:5-methylcytosine-specific restriction protein A
MTAIILAWNPDRWNAWNYTSVVEQVGETGQFLNRWSVGRNRSVPAGSDAWLLLQGRHGRGLIGHGTVVSEQPFPAPHYADPNKASMHVGIAFDALLPVGDQIRPGILKEAVPGVPWDGIRGSGLAIDPAEEEGIRKLWRESGPPPASDPTQPVPGTYPEWAVSRVAVNRFERSPEARRACIAHHGTSCAACGFSFEVVYGGIGRDFIDVHHIVPVSQLGNTYQLDPVTDLVPLCANCHAMAHHGVSTPRTPAELRQIIAGAGFISGHALQPEELQSQRDARRILETGPDR